MSSHDRRIFDRALREASRFRDLHPDLHGEAFERAITAHLEDFQEHPSPGETPAERALELCHRAYGIREIAERVKLAREALDLDPACPEAFELLAEGEEGDYGAALGWLEKAFGAGKSRLGEQRLAELQGRLHDDVDARVILRAKLLMARLESLRGNHAAAVRHGRDLLRLDRSDRLGGGLFHLVHLLHDGRDEEALRLAEEMIDFEAQEAEARGPLIALMAHACALFRTEGETDRSVGALLRAVEANPCLMSIPAEAILSSGDVPLMSDEDNSGLRRDALATYLAFARLFQEDPLLGTWVGESLALLLTSFAAEGPPSARRARRRKGSGSG